MFSFALIAQVVFLAVTYISAHDIFAHDVQQKTLSAHVLGTSTSRTFPEAPVVHAVPVRAFSQKAPQRKTSAQRLYLKDAHAAVVIDVASGEILYDQNAHQHRPIASLTKLYTAYLVRTSGVALDAPVTLREEALHVIGSRVGCKTSTTCTGKRLAPGEVVTVRDLLTAMLVVSANDAARSLARYVAGSEEAFVNLMNDRARELGLKDSHFCTPSGLEVEGKACYSSAADIGRIAALALHDTVIWQLLNTKRTEIKSKDGAYTHVLEATNKFAETQDVPGMIGAKTGFTPQAGKSLLLAAVHPEKKEKRIVAVILGDPWRWRDMKTLVTWTWDAYEW